MSDVVKTKKSGQISGLILAIAAGIALGKMAGPVGRPKPVAGPEPEIDPVAMPQLGSDTPLVPTVVSHAAVVNPNPVAISHRPGLVGVMWSVVDRIGRDNVSMVAAGVAFYTLLAIFPALAAIVSLYGLFGDPAEVSRQIAPFSEILPREALTLINDGLTSFVAKKSSQFNIALVTGVLLALWSARAGMASVMTGLNIAYEETERRSLVVQNLVALGMTFAAILIAIAIVFAIGIIPAALALLHVPTQLATTIALARWPLLAVIILLGFAVLYRFAPCRQKAKWEWITWGSATATALWLGGSWLFSFYVGHFGSYDATYGSLGAVVVLLLWFWVAALVFLLGAEVDAELHARARATGSPTKGLPTSR
ncbi:YihY/virulence factor BrkB family protein [Lichenihabitans psoromatis]|uniref:YihY/virulence factor BrkB family protein n=1 Tax=Lichenihabitans psoromatis TaxID=2528642 RepID=UPI001035FCDF|nr:YihY/virulence factor BrkB family protein [Lichenihabitans psoromatis]